MHYSWLACEAKSGGDGSSSPNKNMSFNDIARRVFYAPLAPRLSMIRVLVGCVTLSWISGATMCACLAQGTPVEGSRQLNCLLSQFGGRGDGVEKLFHA